PRPVTRTAPAAIPAPSLHDALPISAIQGIVSPQVAELLQGDQHVVGGPLADPEGPGHALVMNRQVRAPEQVDQLLEKLLPPFGRSEEHTSELQSRENLGCRLLLEKK